jgi:glyoxylase-like metal-dependent hydrolase (beta-lactamase superfamily II)
MAGIELIPLPGHTPGHSGYLFRGEQDNLLLWADAVHLQDVQTADPQVALIFDVVPAPARHTRSDLLAQVAKDGWMIAGGHGSGFGRVKREGSAYKFVPC